MASAHYTPALQLYATGGINLSSDTLKVRLVRTSAYTFSATDQFASALPAAIVTDATLASKTVTGGVLDAADSTFTAVPSGAAINALVVYKDTGNAATSPLVGYIDGFTVTPNGGDITIQWAGSSPNILKV